MVRILLTNDDGIHSDGLMKLEEALREVGDVYVVAPASEMSGASHSLTLSRPLRIRRIDERHWTVDGTPTDCVTLALNQILAPDEMPDICCSGINHGGNLGDDATYSGTVAGENFDFTQAARFAVTAARKVLEEGLPEGTLLNINVPPGEIGGVRVTRQGIKKARPIITEHIEPRGNAYYWIGEEYYGTSTEDGTDYAAVEAGCVSVTPLRSDMTNHSALDALDLWNRLGAEAVEGREEDQPAGLG